MANKDTSNKNLLNTDDILKMINDIAIEIQNKMKDKLKNRKSSGDLINTIKYKIINNQNFLNLLFYFESYGIFIDQGVKGSKSSYPESSKSIYKFKTKQPPSKAIENFIDSKNIRSKSKINKKSLVYLIARSIKNKGIRAAHFTDVIDEYENKLNELISESLKNKIENMIDSDLNDIKNLKKSKKI